MTDTAVSLPRRLLRAVFGTRNDRLLKKMRKTLETINEKPAAEFWKEVEEQQKGKQP